MSRPRSSLLLMLVALVVPATASGDYKSLNSIVGSTAEKHGQLGSENYTTVNAATGADTAEVVGASRAGYRSLNAVVGPTPATPFAAATPFSDASDPFDWADAAIGAAVTMALIALAGVAVRSVRWHRRAGLRSRVS